MRVFVGIVIAVLFSDVLLARDIEIRPATAAKYGIEIEQSSPNPGVVQIVLHFKAIPKDLGFVVYDSKGNFVASMAVPVRDRRCSVILNRDHLQRSYFAFPYIAGADESVHNLFLSDTP